MPTETKKKRNTTGLKKKKSVSGFVFSYLHSTRANIVFSVQTNEDWAKRTTKKQAKTLFDAHTRKLRTAKVYVVAVVVSIVVVFCMCFFYIVATTTKKNKRNRKMDLFPAWYWQYKELHWNWNVSKSKAKAFHQKQHIEHNNNNDYNHVNVLAWAPTIDLE